ncbi:MAG: class I SAM-dependent methyltransferase [Acidobacteria bacterium]|nr:class I SAM-dependent methyltransferase [Acidobacteriota bacterium]
MALVRRILKSQSPRSVVEVGPGMGGPSWYIADSRSYVGYEPDTAAFEVASSRLKDLPDAIVFNDQIPEEGRQEFDALVALEVLEHLEDDLGALNHWVDWVTPGGIVIISVPAKAARFGPWDAAVGHFRRYEREELRHLMASAGLTDPQVLAYGMPIGYLLETVRNRVLVHRLPVVDGDVQRTLRSGRSFQPLRYVNLVTAVMWPFQLLQRGFVRTSFGIGWVATGRVA